MAGSLIDLPKSLIDRMHGNDKGIGTNEETAKILLNCILEDRRLFLSPLLLAADRLLAEAVRRYWEKDWGVQQLMFQKMTDRAVLCELEQSEDETVRTMIHSILYEPERIVINTHPTGKGLPVSVRKIYDRLPQVINPSVDYRRLVDRTHHQLMGLRREYELVLA